MRNRAALSAIVALLVLTLAVPATAGAGDVDPVKTGKKSEFLPAPGMDAMHDYFAWSQPVNHDPHVFLQIDGGPRDQIDTGVVGFTGAFADGDDRLIYQRVSFPGGRAQSDLRLYDVSSGLTSGFGPTVNNARWQWAPSYDVDGMANDWLLYGENHFAGPTAPWKVMLFDGSTGDKTVLAETTYRCACIFPGTFAYPWVSWSKGRDGDVWRMNILTDVKERLSVPGDRDEHSIAVTSDGTAYVAQAGDRCGTNAKLFRIDPDGTATRLAALPARTEAYTLATRDTGTGIDLYFDRIKCSTESFDIFRISDADTAGPTVVGEHMGSGSTGSPASRRLPPGAIPPSR